jgi:DNA-binding PadR family transcriptional regulator
MSLFQRVLRLRPRHIRPPSVRLIALGLIAEQPRHGYDIVKQLKEKTAGWYSPSPGIVYPSLAYLEKVGYLTSQADGAKKLYTITEGGEPISRRTEILSMRP